MGSRPATARALIDLQCDVGQGHLFCRPVSGADVTAYLRTAVRG
jgi:EAL domain-containing protein (putative c-di-GMP-specific phosphodiesterase class I)